MKRLAIRCSKLRRKFSKSRTKLAPETPFSLPSPSPSIIWHNDKLSHSTSTSTSSLLALPFEVVEIIVQAVIDLHDFITAASFAKASSAHKELIESALVAAYRRHDLQESHFRHYLQVDYSIFNRHHLAEYRLIFCRRHYNHHDEKKLGTWHKTVEEKLLEGKNTFILAQPDAVTYFSSAERNDDD